MAEYSLQFVIDVVNKGRATFNEVEKNLNGVKKKLEDFQPAFKKMALVGGAAFGAITLAVKQSLDAYKESEAELTRADEILKTLSTTALNTMGGSFESAQKKIRAFGSQLQAMGGIADEAGAVGVAKLTQITKDYEKAQQAALVAADLSKYKQIDYATAIDIVGKVLNGNTAILQRYGIEISKNVSAEEAMAELAKRVAGQYEAYGKTLQGQTEILQQRFDDLKETIGKALAPILTNLLQEINPIIERFIAWAEANPELLKNITLVAGGIAGLIAVVGTLGMILPSIIGGFTALGSAIAFLVSNPIGLIILAIIALIAVIVEVVKHWDTIKEVVLNVWGKVTSYIKEQVDAVITILSGWVNSIVLIFQNIYYFIKGFIIMIAEVLRPIWEPIVQATILAFNWLAEKWNILKVNAILFWTLFKDQLSKIWNILYENFKLIWTKISDFFVSIWETIKNTFKNAIDWIMNKLQPLFNAYERLKSMAASVGAKLQEQVSAVIEIGKGGLNTSGSRQFGGEIPRTGWYMLHKGEYVNTARAMGNIVVNINGGYYLSESVAEEIGDMIIDKLKRVIKL